MSSASSVTVSALTILENPCKASPRMTVFTSHLYIGAPDLEKIQGSVRYYSEQDGEYPDIGVYHVTMAVAKMEKGVNVFTTDAKDEAEYSFVGDIKSFFLIGELDSPAVANIDLAQRPYVNVCGAVTRSDTTAATFTLDVEQYTTAFADQAKQAAEDAKKRAVDAAANPTTTFAAAPIPLKSVFPVTGHIPDSPRYKSKKPVPWVKRFVSFGGYITGVSAALEGETIKERFLIDVENIAFLGSFTPLAATPSTTASASSSAGSSGTYKKSRFNYGKGKGKRSRDDDDDDDAGPSSPSPFVYSYIGQFVRGRLRPHVSVFGLSATLEPGIPTAEVCQSLGFRDYQLFRFSNERLDIQLILEPLQHAVQTYEISTNLYLYLIDIDKGGQAGHRIRQYNSLCRPEFNTETLRLLETDPRLQIIIATIALANGVHSSAIDDVLMFQMPKTLSQAEQQAGRASRPQDATGKAVIFVQKSDLKNAKKFMANAASATLSAPPTTQQAQARKKKAQPAWERMDPAKAEFLVETRCLNAVRNRRWQNEPLSETDRDCITAKRPLPCSLCAARANISIAFPQRNIPHSPFPIPSTAKRSPVPRATKLKKKERPTVMERLAGFGALIFDKEIYTHCHRLRIKSWFFPSSLQAKLADMLLRLTAAAELDGVLKTHDWPFRSSSYQDDLWDLIQQLQTTILNARKTEASTSKKDAQVRK
ncbi:hypothetical protein C8R45DRAFT_1107949 [Mycena sanguinolenta]|nr:hypothetical protein C8R45DRAFT_1107949 [Mycena sanguinolenta]